MKDTCARCGHTITWSDALRAWLDRTGVDPQRCLDTSTPHGPAR